HPARSNYFKQLKSSVSAIPPPRRDNSEFMSSTLNLQGQRSRLCDNQLTRMPVAVRIDRARHPFVLCSVVEQPRGLLDNFPPVRADELGGSSRHAFGAFGHFAQRQYRLAEARSLFLQSAGIGQDQIRSFQQLRQRKVFERFC